MSRTVFILGAGASAKAGAPVMATFIRSATQISRNHALNADEKKAFELVLKARSVLQSVHSKSDLNIDNIESLFGAFEMADLIGKLDGLSRSEIENLPQSMSKIIARTIEVSIRYPVKENFRVLPPFPYEQFAQIIRGLNQDERRSVSVVTFNYDVALDYALQFSSTNFDYCLSSPLDADAKYLANKYNIGAIDLLKLHGSLNWARCGTCNNIVPWSFPEFFKAFNWGTHISAKTVQLEMSDKLPLRSHCDLKMLGDPLIVPPTWNKGRFHQQLSSVWRTAASHLSEAENIFVIGYSLPPTDEFFRYFYALGSVGQSVLNTFCVIDKDPAVSDRFRSILGPSAQRQFKFIPSTFEDSLGEIRERLGLPRGVPDDRPSD